MDKPYLSVQELARHFGVTPTTIYRLAQRGKLPGFKVGFQWRFSRQMLDSWVLDQVTVEGVCAAPRAKARPRARREDEHS